MDLSHLLAAHGSGLVALGALAEGETVLVLAGLAEHRGLMDWRVVLAVAATAAWCGDQALFWLGRAKGTAWLGRWPLLAAHSQRVRGWVETHPAGAVLGLRFAYGLRLIGPLLIGASSIDARRFALFNAIGAVVWAALFTGLGWWLGAAAERWVHDLAQAEWALLLALAAVAAWWLWQRRGHTA